MTHELPTQTAVDGLSLIVPASNEAGEIGACLDAVLTSDWTSAAGLECLVVANGCRDATVEVAQARAGEFRAKGWDLVVLDLAEGGKLNALNQGDRRARYQIRAYLDADVRVSPPLLAQLFDVLNTEHPRYASGTCIIARPKTWVSRAYRRIYRQVPFMTHGVPGCGLFAVNASGRGRWNQFPDIISDDTFVRLSFAPNERKGVPAPYQWPIVEGWSNLVRVRRRQNKGVEQIEQQFPHLLKNDDKPAFPAHTKLAMALRDPLGFAVYSGVALAVRLTKRREQDWSRGR